MRSLVAGVALISLLTVSAVPRPLPAIVSSEGRPPGSGRVLVCAIPVAGGFATVRNESSPFPDQSARSLAVLGRPTVPAPSAATVPAETTEALERSLLKLHRPREPPPST